MLDKNGVDLKVGDWVRIRNGFITGAGQFAQVVGLAAYEWDLYLMLYGSNIGYNLNEIEAVSDEEIMIYLLEK